MYLYWFFFELLCLLRLDKFKNNMARSRVIKLDYIYSVSWCTCMRPSQHYIPVRREYSSQVLPCTLAYLHTSRVVFLSFPILFCNSSDEVLFHTQQINVFLAFYSGTTPWICLSLRFERYRFCVDLYKTVWLEVCSPTHATSHVLPEILNVIIKAVPLQAWRGPEGSRKLRFKDFMTTAQDGGKVVSLTHRPPLPPGNTRGAHYC